MIKRTIPSSGEDLPIIGIGTWQVFDVSTDKYPVVENVLDVLHKGGGTLIDTSPMYAKAEKAIGDVTSGMETGDDFFYATKVWTNGSEQGIRQMQASMEKMQRETIDLVQIHNLVDWKTHLVHLRKWKEEVKIRYIGITHYTDEHHGDLERVMKTEKPDFVQFNYSITSRHAEKRLLDVARDLGIATLINRPFGTGNLFSLVKGKALPAWAKENGIDNWAAYFLKYIIAHPAVTCVIPATANPDHHADNVKAGSDLLPDENLRKKMVEYLKNL
ncbi:MAG: aldo/keto reductase [Bacteroidota bacterium]|nr:aldo/keto reductase [Bacteroidota bacterium]